MTDVLPTLLVDDDPHQRELVRRLFDRAGVGPVFEAHDAEHGLAMAVEHQPRLILLDLEMPGRSGLEVLPDVLAACPQASVVVLSNLPRRHYGDTALAAGAVGYLEKRVPADRLVAEAIGAASLGAAVARHVTADLERSASSPGVARGLVRDLLGTQHAELLETVELLVTELVTNAVVHASAAPRVEVELRPDLVRVAVHDADPTLPHRRPPDVGRPGGRGLLLLDQLAARWAAEPTGAGKVVWFELAR